MYWIVLIGLLLAGAWKGGIVGEADREVLGRFWQYAEERELAGLPAGERVVAAGRFFEGVPYEGGTLGNTPEERVVVNLRAFDCVTFVENVLALALTEGRGERTEEAFVGQLVRLRYRDGEARDYASRLHYSSDWLAEMVRAGILEDVTCGLGGERYAPEVNFMTAHAEAYPALKACGALREKMRVVEDSIRARTYYYIPKERVEKVAAQIKTGDVILITTTVEGLDTSHLGFAVVEDGEVYLLHASSERGRVVLSEEPLAAYLAGNRMQSGIMVGRLTNRGG